jgi:hypothetical protein
MQTNYTVILRTSVKSKVGTLVLTKKFALFRKIKKLEVRPISLKDHLIIDGLRRTMIFVM